MMKDVDRDGRSAIHIAALSGNLPLVLGLIAKGVSITPHDNVGLTPLHLASQQGNASVVAALLEAGAEVDPEDSWGNTPLWTAVFNSKGDDSVVRLLREGGADPWHVNKAGKSALELARMIGSFDAAKFFADLTAD